MNKKAAVELSISTIVMVIIGVALLGLGLMWVRGIFGNLEGLTKDAFETAKKQLDDKMTEGTNFDLSVKEVEIKRGEGAVIAAGVRNIDNSKKRLEVKVSAAGEGSKWVSVEPKTSENTDPDQIYPFFIKIKPGKDAVIGETYNFVAHGKIVGAAEDVDDPVGFSIIIT